MCTGGVGVGTGMGTARRETFKIVDTKHPDYNHEHPDQAHIPLQSGTNKFASQKGRRARTLLFLFSINL
jgi:hypothetical protein